jgi:hypothetical protein
MTISLDPALTFGQTTVVALTRRRVSSTRLKQTFFVGGHKRPVAFLLRRGKTMSALAPDGTTLSQAEVEALCPGAWQSIAEAN